MGSCFSKTKVEQPRVTTGKSRLQTSQNRLGEKEKSAVPAPAPSAGQRLGSPQTPKQPSETTQTASSRDAVAKAAEERYNKHQEHIKESREKLKKMSKISKQEKGLWWYQA